MIPPPRPTLRHAARFFAAIVLGSLASRLDRLARSLVGGAVAAPIAVRPRVRGDERLIYFHGLGGVRVEFGRESRVVTVVRGGVA